jgi:hypothetical protein
VPNIGSTEQEVNAVRGVGDGSPCACAITTTRAPLAPL